MSPQQIQDLIRRAQQTPAMPPPRRLPASAAAARIVRWRHEPRRPILLQEVLKTFEELQQEHGLAIQKPGCPVHPVATDAVSTAQSTRKEAFYTLLDDHAVPFWTAAAPALARTAQNWRQRTDARQPPSLAKLFLDTDRTLSTVSRSHFEGLSPAGRELYRARLPGSEQADKRESAGVESHFAGGIHTAVELSFGFLHDVEPLLERYLRTPGARLPPRCQQDPASLFQERFIQDGYSFIRYGASMHFVALELMTGALGMHQDDTEHPGSRTRPTAHWQLVHHEGQLRLALTPEGRRQMAKVPAQLRERLQGALGPRMKCPALRAPLPLHGSVVGGFEAFVRQTAEQYVFPGTSARLSPLLATAQPGRGAAR